MTAASTPEPPSSCGGQKAMKGVSSETTISTCALPIHARNRSIVHATPRPHSVSPTRIATKLPLASASENAPVTTAATAKLAMISAVASLTSPSPSRMVSRRVGNDRRLAIAIGATASGGDTTAPIRNATAHGMPNTQCPTAATAVAVKIVQPIASSRIGRRLRRKPRQLMPTPASYRIGGRSSSITSSGSIEMTGMNGMKPSTPPTSTSRIECGRPKRSVPMLASAATPTSAATRTSVSIIAGAPEVRRRGVQDAVRAVRAVQRVRRLACGGLWGRAIRPWCVRPSGARAGAADRARAFDGVSVYRRSVSARTAPASRDACHANALAADTAIMFAWDVADDRAAEPMRGAGRSADGWTAGRDRTATADGDYSEAPRASGA